MKKDTISSFFRTVLRRPELQAVLPLGYTPGLPVLTSRRGELCVAVPFLRYRLTGEKDKTLVYPVRYVAVYLVPELQLVSFTDLAYTPMADKVDFNRPVGTFRHKAVADLTREQYDALRSDALAGLDALAESLLGGELMTPERDAKLADAMSRLVEPSLHPLYSTLSKNFYNKYISHGKDS